MNSTTEVIADAGRVVGDSVREFLESAAVRGFTDAELTTFVTGAGALLRQVEAALIEATGEVEARSTGPIREERFAVRRGCCNTNDFLQVVTGVAPATAAKWIRVANSVRGRTSVTTGEVMPGALPHLRAAMAAGAVGLDGALAVAGPLMAAFDRADPADFAAADESLADIALAGKGELLPMSADELKISAMSWACALDQDGAEPLDAIAAKKRGITLGAPQDGLVSISGMLLTEVAAQFNLLDSAINNPRLINGRNADKSGVRFVDSDADRSDIFRDTRTPAQRRHDALATALGIAAASSDVPTLGGAAPTLVVQVAKADLTNGSGWAVVDGTPVSLAVARHTGCKGSIQRVARDTKGRITQLGTEERVFNRHQRRAIALRDQGCVIPGCSVSAPWCEIHHAVEHADGGETHTDNGVLLCWHHHRYLDSNGYSVRMNAGVPEVRLPSWMDHTRRWHPPTPPPADIRPTPRT